MKTSKNKKAVAAGKKRAKEAIRINGRFTTNAFKNEVKRIADEVGFKGKLQKFFLENENELTALYTTGEMQSAVSQADVTAFTDAEQIRGKIYLKDEDGKKKVSLHTMKQKIVEFEQYVYSNYNCTGITFKPSTTLSGDFIMGVPDIELIESEEMSDEDLIEYCEDYGITVYISDLSKIKDKDKRKKEQAKVVRKVERLKKVKRNARTQKTKTDKSGTKRKKR